MARGSKFKIMEFANPSGKTAYRVSGVLHGKQIRKNFKKRSDAVVYRDELENDRLNGSFEGQRIYSKITIADHDDAWTALRLLKGAKSKKSLTETVRYSLEHYREPKTDLTVTEAVRHYCRARKKDWEADAIRFRQYKSIKSEMNRLKRELGGERVAQIQTEDIQNYLESTDISLKTFNNRRGYLYTFFSFCVENGYAVENPVERIKQHRLKHRRGTAETLTPEKASELMHFIETYEGHRFRNGSSAGEPGCLVPFFALALFAGIRPDWNDGEISKVRAAHINLGTDTIHIEPEVSKVNEKRNIVIQPNLKKWMQAYPIEDHPIIPFRNIECALIEVRKKFQLGHDVLRHTFISMLVGKFRSVGDAALQAGNSEQVVRKHYLDVISKEDASAFWEIEPS